MVAVLLCQGVEMKRSNDKWLNSDVIMNEIDEYYSKLAVYIEEDGDQHKRFFSVVSLAMYMYVKSDIIDDVERAKAAVEKTREQLNQPADVIASPMRSLMILLQSFIQQVRISSFFLYTQIDRALYALYYADDFPKGISKYDNDDDVRETSKTQQI
ncbi:uncharacterized protein LOC123722424 [Papilio machaon]|uniref:uncharacterized protein LOC123722424 n=1 Tax=Papilio machaon TaxID=76193 RepID=UPI001E662E2B|nr:uncharacterized protein LOC123722424 [Papilio machaon]